LSTVNRHFGCSFGGAFERALGELLNVLASVAFEPGVDLLDVGERAVFPGVAIQLGCAAARIPNRILVFLWSAASTAM
jgi:hypothetical protein